MALARILPNPYAVFPFIADTTISEGQVLVQGTASGHCTLPAGPNVPQAVLGIARTAAASGTVCDVVTFGIARCKAFAAISAGAYVSLADSSGRVGAVGVASNGVFPIGIALETVTAQDQFVAVMVMIDTPPSLVMVPMTVDTGNTITAGMAVVIGTADNTIAVPGGADPTSGVIGLAAHAAAAAAVCNVIVQGPWFGVASGSVTRGQNLAVAGAAGSLKSAAPGAGTNDMIVGTALSSATNGNAVNVLVRPGMMQG
jgi:hypothetical protein